MKILLSGSTFVMNLMKAVFKWNDLPPIYVEIVFDYVRTVPWREKKYERIANSSPVRNAFNWIRHT